MRRHVVLSAVLQALRTRALFWSNKDIIGGFFN